MKKISVIIICLVALCGMTFVVSKANVSDLGKWGDYLSNISKENPGNGKYSVVLDGTLKDIHVEFKDIYESGEDALITNDSIEKAEKYYVSAGVSEKKAHIEAIKYVEEEQALYVKAISEGYDVNEKEIDEYVDNMKDTVNSAENKEDIKKVIDEFDSEDAFWDYQRIVAKTDLPIINYTKALEKQYRKEHVNDEDVDEGWNKEYESIKSKLVKEQKYKKVRLSRDIKNAFVVN